MPTRRPVSLRWLVPALSAGLLAIVVTAFGMMAYGDVRASAMRTATERLTIVAGVFAQPPQQTPGWIREGDEVARNPGVLDLIRSSGKRVTDSARLQLRRLVPDTGQTLALQVRTADGKSVFSITGPVADSLFSRSREKGGDVPVDRSVGDSIHTLPQPLDPALWLSSSFPDTAAASALYLRNGEVLYERAVPVRERGRLVGHLVELRTIGTSPNAVRQVTTLIGKEASLVVGNADGSLWSDLTKPVSHPPPSAGPTVYVRNGKRWLTAAAKLPSGPWVIGVEFPEDIVLAPARALKWQFVIVGTIVVVLAGILAEWLSRRLTIPLTRLTTAAEHIAEGDRTYPVEVLERSDEIGRLSKAFAAMADAIRESQGTLEHRIDERTVELRATLMRLRETQEELVRKERLATLGQLSGSIAHELRNPLAVMTNALYYLDLVLAEAPAKVREHLGKVREQVKLSESIISDLLEFTRTSKARPASVDLGSVVQEQLKRVSMPGTVRVICAVPSNLPPAFVDPAQIGQVLVNLFTNAVQAMEPHGGVLSVTVRPHGAGLRVEVADSGPGIAAENRERIFEPLFTTKARGIGLGLSVSRSLVQANGGELRVLDTTGPGATLVLDIPVASQGSVTTIEAPAPTSAARTA